MTKSRSLVLFDIDGTLMRGAGPHHKEALIEGVRQVTGEETSLDGIATAGMLDRDLVATMLRVNRVSERRIQRTLRAIIQACEGSYRGRCAADLRPFVCRSVKETLSELQARGAVMGLVTGNFSGIGWKKVELAGLREFFACGAFAEDGRSRARLAQVAAWRARKLGLVEKGGQISLVGDHANDVRAARANGFQAVAIATGVMPMEELAAEEPDILAAHLGEVDLQKLLGPG